MYEVGSKLDAKDPELHLKRNQRLDQGLDPVLVLVQIETGQDAIGCNRI